MKYTQDIYENSEELFNAHGGAKTPTEYAGEAYNRTPCGVGTLFVMEDGEEIDPHDMPQIRDNAQWANKYAVGIRHTTIVEGLDAEFKADILYFPFADKQLAESWEYLNEKVDEAILDNVFKQ